jgi:hypothetical protein
MSFDFYRLEMLFVQALIKCNHRTIICSIVVNFHLKGVCLHAYSDYFWVLINISSYQGVNSQLFLFSTIKHVLPLEAFAFPKGNILSSPDNKGEIFNARRPLLCRQS